MASMLIQLTPDLLTNKLTCLMSIATRQLISLNKNNSDVVFVYIFLLFEYDVDM